MTSWSIVNYDYKFHAVSLRVHVKNYKAKRTTFRRNIMFFSLFSLWSHASSVVLVYNWPWAKTVVSVCLRSISRAKDMMGGQTETFVASRYWLLIAPSRLIRARSVGLALLVVYSTKLLDAKIIITVSKLRSYNRQSCSVRRCLRVRYQKPSCQ